MRYLPLLFLVACTSLEDLERAQLTCEGDECVEISDRIDRYFERRRQKENAKTFCPEGTIAYCTHMDYGCGDRQTHRAKVRGRDYECISGFH